MQCQFKLNFGKFIVYSLVYCGLSSFVEKLSFRPKILALSTVLPIKHLRYDKKCVCVFSF